jgi:hypothetical protein
MSGRANLHWDGAGPDRCWAHNQEAVFWLIPKARVQVRRSALPSQCRCPAVQKAQEAKDEDARNKARLLRSKEEEEQQALLLRIKEEDERRFRALRRKDEEERRMQLFAGRGKNAGKGSTEEGDRKEEELHSARALQGKREGEARGESGGLRQENGTGRFRYENGFAEKANGKVRLFGLARCEESMVWTLDRAIKRDKGNAALLGSRKMSGRMKRPATEALLLGPSDLHGSDRVSGGVS